MSKHLPFVVLTGATIALVAVLLAPWERPRYAFGGYVPPPVRSVERPLAVKAPAPPIAGMAGPSATTATVPAAACEERLLRNGKNLTAERARELCADSPIASVAPPPDQLAACGGAGVVAALRALKQCASANGVCLQTGKHERVDIELDDLLAASRTFPLSAYFFATGKTEVLEPEGLRALVDRGLGGDQLMDFVCVGSASPTAPRDEIDHDIAAARAYDCREIVIAELRRQRALTSRAARQERGIPSVEQVNVGRGLPASFCSWLDEDSRKTCEDRGVLARRQTVLALAYPRACTTLEPGP